ncbi:replication initiation protein RepM [Acinetobacter baumannii]|uniref:replication initiation protein RepM n=1 Tax=Acinetobacter baumannii TaxID=470 RepID=UPI003B43D383
MKREFVVKDNVLINASYSLSLVEQRLMILAIIVARKSGDLSWDIDHWYGKPVQIPAESYEITFNVTRQASYLALKEAAKNLFERRFSYQEERVKGIAQKTSRWVSDIAYIDSTATVEITFSPVVLPLITNLEKHFTSYEIEQVSNLNSPYAVRLYELIISWRSTKKTPIIDLQDFRNRIGVLENEYQRMELFKRRVLEPAISQINTHTDIIAQYEQHKRGRSIIGFSFTFKQKVVNTDRKTPTTLNLFSKMTDAQRHLFANKLSELPDMNKYSQGTESYAQFAVRIAEMLQDKEKFEELLPYLRKVGFSTK